MAAHEDRIANDEPGQEGARRQGSDAAGGYRRYA
jgi:hypothetical protein